MSTIMNVGIMSIAVASFLLVCVVKKRKIKLRHLIDSIHDPYFKPTKQLTIKDEVFINMLESCQNKGPCYVITDPSLRGTLGKIGTVPGYSIYPIYSNTITFTNFT